MLTVFICLAAVLLLLVLNEFLYRRHILKGELKRKFVHILASCFMASWPWLLSWKAIQLIGVAMVIVLVLNRQLRILHYLGGLRERSYGDVFLALAVTVSALITDEKIFFAIAILHIALADGFAAVIGSIYGKNWRYKIFGQTKSVVGTMTFWVVSTVILGVGLLAMNDMVSFSTYTTALIIMPPILAVSENLAPFSLDNLVIPMVALFMLNVIVF
jgi:phytol kinase